MQLRDIPIQVARWLLEGNATERGQVVEKAFGRSETQRIPTWVSNILDPQGAAIAGAQQLIMLRAFTTMLEVSEVLRAFTVRERGIEH